MYFIFWYYIRNIDNSYPNRIFEIQQNIQLVSLSILRKNELNFNICMCISFPFSIQLFFYCIHFQHSSFDFTIRAQTHQTKGWQHKCGLSSRKKKDAVWLADYCLFALSITNILCFVKNRKKMIIHEMGTRGKWLIG